MCKTGLLAAVIALLIPGRGVADTLLALSCDGTATDRTWERSDFDWSKQEPQPITGWGLVLNFSNRTVLGFDPLPGGRALPITSVDDVTVGFGGDLGEGLSVFGTIDRVTGAVSATMTTSISGSTPGSKVALDRTFYELQCRPKRRLF
jgi:hypothetical protein